MKGSDLEFARGLARKAENDWITASSGVDHDFPLDTVCFHVQQAAEKLLKAALVVRGVDYPLTHDLKRLIDLAVAEYPLLAEFRTRLPAYTEFAVVMRYDEAAYPTREETMEALETVGRLRESIHKLLPPEARP